MIKVYQVYLIKSFQIFFLRFVFLCLTIVLNIFEEVSLKIQM